MILLTKGVSSAVILTLTEKQLLASPNYLFVFTGATTNTEFKFVKLNADDISAYKNRYNKFNISSSLFNNERAQEYVYNVYEQTSSTNTDPTGLNLLETGLMILNDSNGEVFTEPNKHTQFIIPQ